jgi:hypothetical protein
MLKRLLFAVVLLVSSEIAQSQEPPQAPQVKSNQQPEHSVKGQQEPAAQPNAADAALPTVPDSHSLPAGNERQSNTQNGGKEGTEFWPPFYGYRLKYVFASDVKVRQFATIPRVTAEFKNFGQTPCDEITFSYNIKVDELPTPKDLCSRPAAGIAPMAPGFGFHLDNSLEVTHEQRSTIAGGKAAIYIFGRIEYRDVFKGPRRHTNFRQVYTGDQFGRAGASKEGNDYS